MHHTDLKQARGHFNVQQIIDQTNLFNEELLCKVRNAVALKASKTWDAEDISVRALACGCLWE